MSVFKLCWRIIRGNILSLILYLGIFLVMSVIIVRWGESSQDMGFSQARVPMAFMSVEDSPLVDGLRRELEKVTTLVDLPQGRDALRDALFFGQVRIALDLPSGFTRAFMGGKPIPLMVYNRPDDPSNRYVEMTIAQFFRLARLYRTALPGIDLGELTNRVSRNMAGQAKVVLHPGAPYTGALSKAKVYFNFMSYSQFNLLILGLCALMLVFNNKEIRLRNACSPLSPRRLHTRIFLSGLIYALVCYAVMGGLCLMILGEPLPTAPLLLFLLNSLVMTLWAASAAFAIGQVTSNRDAVSGVSTVVTLASSFLGGAFVPQEFLGGGLLKFSQFLPTYWYVRANSRITELESLTFSEISATLQAMGMQLLFAIAFLSLALLVARKKRQMA